MADKPLSAAGNRGAVMQYEVDVTITDTIIVEAGSVSEAQDAAYERGYAHVTGVRLIEDEA